MATKRAHRIGGAPLEHFRIGSIFFPQESVLPFHVAVKSVGPCLDQRWACARARAGDRFVSNPRDFEHVVAVDYKCGNIKWLGAVLNLPGIDDR